MIVVREDDRTLVAESNRPRTDPRSCASSAMEMGAYGLRLPDLEDAAGLLVEAPPEWPPWRTALSIGSGTPAEFFKQSHARMRSLPSGWIDMDLATHTSTLHLPHKPPHAHVAHPYLGSTAVVVAYWHGLQSFHAGAFVADGGAWGILGDKGAGKSSMLAALLRLGAPILTDDILVVSEEMRGFAGPRCIDLRRETALALEVGTALGVVGARERWRVHLDPIAAELPLAGWICLDWGEPAILTPPMPERIRALYENIGLRIEQHDPAMLSRLMDLLALPMLRVQRPRSMASLMETARAILDHVNDLQRSTCSTTAQHKLADY
jgi:hypothetical protein